MELLAYDSESESDNECEVRQSTQVELHPRSHTLSKNGDDSAYAKSTEIDTNVQLEVVISTKAISETEFSKQVSNYNLGSSKPLDSCSNLLQASLNSSGDIPNAHPLLDALPRPPYGAAYDPVAARNIADYITAGLNLTEV